MPTRRAPGAAENWFDAPPPQTLLQRCAFLDQCTKWFGREPDEGPPESFEEDMRTLPPEVARSRAGHHQTCFTESETRYLDGIRQCIVCGATKGVGVVLANPFAIRSYVGMCARCA
jgi:hypothetical protein